MDRNVVITGANRGIGLELVKRYKESGDKVYALCRKSSDELNSLNVTVISNVEVTCFETLKKTAQEIRGEIDLLICNAGILRDEPFTDLQNGDFSKIEEQFQVNTLGPVKTLMSFLPYLKAGSKVAMITSRMGSIADNSSGGHYGYRMSKGALNNLCQSLSFDTQQKKVFIGMFHPGWVQTEMTGRTGHLTALESSTFLFQRINQLSEENQMGFWHPDGELLPW